MISGLSISARAIATRWRRCPRIIHAESDVAATPGGLHPSGHYKHVYQFFLRQVVMNFNPSVMIWPMLMRAEAPKGVLKHDLHLATIRAQVLSFQGIYGHVVQQNRTFTVDEPQNRLSQGGFPEPLSPTIPNVSPLRSDKEMSLTALM